MSTLLLTMVLGLMILLTKALHLTGDDQMDIRERLRSVIGSYEDFVDYTAVRMEKDEELKNKVIDYMDSNPNAGTGSILEVVINHLGIGEPLEIVDDEEEVLLTVAG